MKKIILILLLPLLLHIEGYGQNRSIIFSDKPFSELQALAKAQNKLIFMDAYAVWCGPCKWMSANIFTRDEIADYYNQNFICTKVDMEKGEGLELRTRYGVMAYPTLLFINSEGEMVHKRVGAPQEVATYIDMAKQAQTPGAGLAAMMRSYDLGNSDPAFIAAYLQARKDAYMPTTPVMEKYMAGQKEEALLSRQNWNLMVRFTDDMNSREFKFLVKNREQYGRLYTPDSVDSKISEILLGSLMKEIRNRQFTQESYDKAKTRVRESGFPGADKVVFTADINLYLMRNMTREFLETAAEGTQKYFSDNQYMLNAIAWEVYQRSDEDKYLLKAAEWAKMGIALQSDAAVNDTYAHILFKLGRTEEAIQYETIALDLARKSGLDTKEYEEALKGMTEKQ